MGGILSNQTLTICETHHDVRTAVVVISRTASLPSFGTINWNHFDSYSIRVRGRMIRKLDCLCLSAHEDSVLLLHSVDSARGRPRTRKLPEPQAGSSTRYAGHGELESAHRSAIVFSGFNLLPATGPQCTGIYHPGDIGLRREMGLSISVALTLVHGSLEQRAEDLGPARLPSCSLHAGPDRLSIRSAFISIWRDAVEEASVEVRRPNEVARLASGQGEFISRKSVAEQVVRFAAIDFAPIDHASEELLRAATQCLPRTSPQPVWTYEVLWRPAEGCRDPSSSGRPRTAGRLPSGDLTRAFPMMRSSPRRRHEGTRRVLSAGRTRSIQLKQSIDSSSWRSKMMDPESFDFAEHHVFRIRFWHCLHASTESLAEVLRLGRFPAFSSRCCWRDYQRRSANQVHLRYSA